jgi:hypothetical protein
MRSTVPLGKVMPSRDGRRNQRNFRQPAKPYAFNFVIGVNRIAGRESTLRSVRISHETSNDRSLETEVDYCYGPIVFCNFHGQVAGEKDSTAGDADMQQNTGTSNGELEGEERDAASFPQNDRVRWKKE